MINKFYIYHFNIQLSVKIITISLYLNSLYVILMTYLLQKTPFNHHFMMEFSLGLFG